MAVRKFCVAGLLAFALGACGGADIATRGAPAGAAADRSLPQVRVAAFNVQGINVTVPTSLEVSEANRYYPGGDIVWRGEPQGNRYEQVKAIFADGFGQGAKALNNGQPVVVDVTVLRFHSLTEKARYTVGGVHSIDFNLTVRSAETGAVIIPTRHVKADLKAFGGDKALAAERVGQTQRVRVVAHLANVLQREMSVAASPEVAQATQAKLKNAL